ncbi:hypothetical protein GWG54_15705 [Natronococcus sp. JC468]|uniref:hypothetical protein n=1 Tax=Natronococcus sp. JC468 TaxID=1961921 RepID=UPI001439B50D|nr:hypothetical protein [Natronococcus sp. JC468]NKE37241.1 hypothetical protein [Natronococcus sp. JC468]
MCELFYDTPVANRIGCDYVFTSGVKRSPIGEAIFGDVLQRLMLRFDSYVTTNVRWVATLAAGARVVTARAGSLIDLVRCRSCSDSRPTG